MPPKAPKILSVTENVIEMGVEGYTHCLLRTFHLQNRDGRVAFQPVLYAMDGQTMLGDALQEAFAAKVLRDVVETERAIYESGVLQEHA